MKTTCHGGPTCPVEMAPPPPIEVLAKHIAAHKATHVRENEMKDPIRSARKAVKKAVKKTARQHQQARKSAVDVKSRATGRAMRLSQLETLIKSAVLEQEKETGLPSSPAIADPGLAYLLAKEQLASGREHDRLIAAMQRGLVPPSQPAAIAAASAGSIATAQGPAVNRPGLNQRAALLAVRDSKVVSETLPGQTELPSLVQLHKLEKQLRDAATPEERERIGYTLTRLSLVRAHRLGEI